MQNPSTGNDPPPPTEPLNTGGISTAQFQLLMDEIKKNREDVQQRLDKLEGDVAAGQDNAAQIVVQKLKADRSYTFRKKGLSQHKWSGHKWSGGTIYNNINGPGGPFMHRHKWSG